MKIILLYVVFLVAKNEAFDSTNYNIIRHFSDYEAITDYLIGLSEEPNLRNKLKIRRIGVTNEGHIIPLVIFGMNKYADAKERHNKPIILIDAGIHAREWITTAALLYVIHELAEKEEHEYLMYDVDWYIVPTLNPEGYMYTRTYTNARMWRKNRVPGKRCYGVDLNRNFDFHWGDQPTSSKECSNTYRGRHPFSERETRALRDTITRLGKRVKLYISLHSFGEYILYPWGYTNASVSEHFEYEHKKLGNEVAKAMNSVNGGHYIAGRQSDILYKAAGISIDWAAGVAKVPLTFILEIGNKKDKFTPSPNTIIPTGKELLRGLKEFHRHVMRNYIKEFLLRTSIRARSKRAK